MPFHAMKNLLYNLSCNVPYLQQNNPATNQNQRQPSTSSYVHASNNILQLQKQKFNNLIHKIFFIDTMQLTHKYVIPTGLIAPMTDIQPLNFVCQKIVTASFSIAFYNLSVKPKELGLSLLSQQLTFGHDKPRIILPTPHLCCQHQIKAQISSPPHSLHIRPPCTIR